MTINFDITNRFTGAVQFTADIDCAEDARHSVKLGMAVQWGIKTRANLARAYLAGAYLAGANLAGAYLAGANLAGANLAGAYLAGAYLADANLADAKWRDGITITQAPIQIYGLYWPVTILDEHMQIGCELHRLSEWETFDADRIGRMDARQAKKFWAAHKDALLSMARGAGRSFATAEVECAA